MQRKKKYQLHLQPCKIVLYLIFLWAIPKNNFAQSNISFQCAPLHLSISQTLGIEPVTEDDPDYLSEAHTYLIAYYPLQNQSANQRFELRFPSKVGTYHWTQAREDEKTDSLYAFLIYDTDPKTYGYTIEAFPKDFTITITHYENKKRGIVEGKFEGTMEGSLSWKRETVPISVKGSFQTTRTGKSGGDCRKQRKSEKEVITKAVSVFDKVLLPPLQKTDWLVSKKEDGLLSQIGINPAPFRPLFLCGDFFELKLTLNPDSPYGKMINDSLKYYNQQLTTNRYDSPEFKTAADNLFRLGTLNKVSISISANSPYLGEDRKLGKNDWAKDLHIPGVAYAWQYYEAPLKEIDTPKENTILCFGNWTGANMHAGTYVVYPFIHKQQSPIIENFVVVISAPTSVANDLIKKIDWAQLNDALTK
ncbi:MAG: hypothetical protein JST23_00660 [Bacteroidetes bacterium]|nr:hypothetical protein [Bacteroidota bacterium]